MSKEPKGKRNAPIKDIKHYQMEMPAELFEEIQNLADSKGVTVVAIIRQFISLGMLVMKDPDTTIILKKGDTQREIFPLF